MIVCGKCGNEGYIEVGFHITDIDKYGGAAIQCDKCKAKLYFDWPPFIDTKALMEDSYPEDWIK